MGRGGAGRGGMGWGGMGCRFDHDLGLLAWLLPS